MPAFRPLTFAARPTPALSNAMVPVPLARLPIPIVYTLLLSPKPAQAQLPARQLALIAVQIVQNPMPTTLQSP